MNDVNHMNRKVLEELKAMGRMDGDGVTSDTGDEVAVEWRKKCEGLRDLVTQFQDERREWLDRCKANDVTYDALSREHTKSRAECEQLRRANDTLQDELNRLGRERQEWLDRCKANDATYDSLQREHRELQAEHEHLRAVGGFPGMVKEIEALHIIIKHMAPLL